MALRIDGSTPNLRPTTPAAEPQAPADAAPDAVVDGFVVHRSQPNELITEGSSSAAAPQGDLQQGMSGPAVQQLQQDLVQLGFLSQADMNTGPGIFGPHTLAAVKAFQAAHGVPTTGYYGPLTRGALESALTAAAPAPAPAPVGTTGVPPMDLKQGDSGANVEMLQNDLVKLGFLSQSDMNTGPGIFGPHTEAALRAFQAAHGVPSTGYYGSMTRAALTTALGGGAPAPAPAPTPQPSTGVPQVDLQQGDNGANVQLLQTDLVKLGYMSQADMNTGPGIFGPHTEAALRAFQAAYGVPSTGYYGPLSRAALTQALAGKAPNPIPSGGGDLAKPAEIARQYLGQNIGTLKYNSALDLDTWPANTVCCANFVSACLEKAGEIPSSQHNDNVQGLVSNLEADGWREIPLADAQPGDVVTFDGPEGPGQHVELFNGWVNGRPQYIGSNNINPDGSQQISYDSGSWAYGVHIYRHP